MLKYKNGLIIQIIMYLFVGAIWLFALMPNIGFERYLTHYPIPLTMVGGGFISGFTICGGGAVSFPIFCKVLKLDPMMARDFALGIQSFGMTCAAVTILIKKIPIEKRVAVFCSAGSFFGLIMGNLYIMPRISSENMKILFSILVAAFGVSLLLKTYVLNKNSAVIYERLPDGKGINLAVLTGIGFIGGLFTAVLGTGADIIAFSIITILYKINEKVLNPTSDIIMAISSVMGLLMRIFFFGGIHPDAAAGFPLAIPIVVIMAPLGAMIASKISRLHVIKFLLIFILVDIISTFYTLRLDILETISLIGLFCAWMIFYLLLLKTAGIIEKRRKNTYGN